MRQLPSYNASFLRHRLVAWRQFPRYVEGNVTGVVWPEQQQQQQQQQRHRVDQHRSSAIQLVGSNRPRSAFHRFGGHLSGRPASRCETNHLIIMIIAYYRFVCCAFSKWRRRWIKSNCPLHGPVNPILIKLSLSTMAISTKLSSISKWTNFTGNIPHQLFDYWWFVGSFSSSLKNCSEILVVFVLFGIVKFVFGLICCWRRVRIW